MTCNLDWPRALAAPTPQGVVQSRSHAELDGAGGRGDDRLEGTRGDKYGGKRFPREGAEKSGVATLTRSRVLGVPRGEPPETIK